MTEGKCTGGAFPRDSTCGYIIFPKLYFKYIFLDVYDAFSDVFASIKMSS